jgi:hypothetical protein
MLDLSAAFLIHLTKLGHNPLFVLLVEVLPRCQFLLSECSLFVDLALQFVCVRCLLSLLFNPRIYRPLAQPIDRVLISIGYNVAERITQRCSSASSAKCRVEVVAWRLVQLLNSGTSLRRTVHMLAWLRSCNVLGGIARDVSIVGPLAICIVLVVLIEIVSVVEGALDLLFWVKRIRD